MTRPKGNRPEPAKKPVGGETQSRTRRPLPQASDQPKRNLKPYFLFGGGAVVLIAFIVFVTAGLSGEVSGVPDGIVEVPVQSRNHVDGSVAYEGHPAGGDHASIWLNCGVYDEPVPNENAVHSLEHGVVWITYPTGAGQETIDQLATYARNPKVIVSPVDGQETPVLVTAWGMQMPVDDPNDSRIEQFIVAFAGGGNAPEPSGACSGGIGQPD